jgi:hypothetical protein
MFRSLLCLTLSGETLSFTKWVDKLRSQPLFAALSGFVGKTPGIGTFYDFTTRLYPSLFTHPPRDLQAWKQAYHVVSGQSESSSWPSLSTWRLGWICLSNTWTNPSTTITNAYL